MANKLPLEGIRIADITGVWAGTTAMWLLGDLGAEVIRVESTQTWQTFTRGTWARPTKAMVARLAPQQGGYVNRDPGARPWNRWPFFNGSARNKLSMTVDLRKPEGIAVLERLLKVSDALAENSQADAMEKLGVTWEWVHKVNPKLVYMRMPAMGTWGPYKSVRLYGSGIESVVGHTAMRGYTDLMPSERAPGVLFSDGAGVGGAYALLAALYYAKKTGTGMYAECSQGENVVPLMGQGIMEYTLTGRVPDSLGNRHPAYAPQGCYPCRATGKDKDSMYGRYVVLSVRSDEEWQKLVMVMGSPPWAADPKFATAASRQQHHDELDQLIGQWTVQREDTAVFQLLQREGIPAGPVYSARGTYSDPQLLDRGFYKEVTQEECGTHLYPGWAAQFSETPLAVRYPPVRLGEHNEYVYKELLGYSAEEYKELERTGHIGMDFAPNIR